MNKPVRLGLSILEVSKILMYEIWYNYEGLKYGEKAKLSYMDSESFVDIYKYIAEEVETRLHTSNYESDRPLPKGKNKKVIGLMKDELGGKIMRKSLGLKQKLSYSIDDESEDKKTKGTK